MQILSTGNQPSTLTPTANASTHARTHARTHSILMLTLSVMYNVLEKLRSG